MVVDVLLDGVVVLEELDDELAVLLALDPQLVGLLLDLDDPLSLAEERLLQLLVCPL